MLSFIRRLTYSRVGIVITFAILILIALAFAAGDVTGLKQGGGPTGDVVATVGDTKVHEPELQTRAQSEMESFRQQQPTLDITLFIAGGGLEGTLERVINGLALEQFARAQGMTVAKKTVDQEIASIPGLQGPDGKFSQQIYQRLLADRKLTDAGIRADVAREMLSQQMIVPTVGATQVPSSVAINYASLLLEKREGQVAFIPTRAMGAGAQPTDAELTTFYQRNIARFTIPERRVIRFANVRPDTIAAAAPTDQEIAQAYQSQRAKFAATEKRTIRQVILLTQAAADALAAKVKAGTPIADAAKASGLEAATFTSLEKAAFATQSSPAMADAAFAATKGSVVGPVKTALGFAVARIEAVEQVPGKSLDQARAELTKALIADKTTTAMTKIHDALDDAIADKATFDELVTDQKLKAISTPPLLANGTDPNSPQLKPSPDFAQILAAAFQAEQGDSPQLVQTNADGSFALVALERIVPAAPEPLAKVRAAVERDFVIDRARMAARKVAGTVVAQLNKGTPLAEALSATKLPLPAVQPLVSSRAQIAANPRGIPPPLALLFSMVEGTSKLLEAPQQGGWFIIKLNHIERGDASKRPDVVTATRADIGKVIGREYVQQFTEAVRRAVGVKKNAAAIAQVKAALTGTGRP